MRRRPPRRLHLTGLVAFPTPLPTLSSAVIHPLPSRILRLCLLPFLKVSNSAYADATVIQRRRCRFCLCFAVASAAPAAVAAVASVRAAIPGQHL